MPSLVMRAPVGSLLEQTSRLVVERQQSYGRSLGIPWGISESAYNARDIEFTYQYSNFGVPGLGLKRGLSENVVIAPYATGLAAMVDPHGCTTELRAALPRWERAAAMAFTKRSISPDRGFLISEAVAIVRSFMAHHQGMTIVAIANALHDGQMRDRFHREPMIQASELLLQERMPRDVAVAHPRAEEVKASAIEADAEAPTVRRLSGRRRRRPDNAFAVERALRGDADRHGGGLQPLARYCRDTMAGGHHPRRLGLASSSCGTRRAETSGLRARSRSEAMRSTTKWSSARIMPNSSAAMAR